MAEVAAASVGAEVIEEIDWGDVVTLKPGVDFHDGVTYFTLPTRLNVQREVKRGKKVEVLTEKVDGLAVITSDGAQFAYNAENLAKIGFSMPEHVTLDKNRRWSREGILEFLSGDFNTPNPLTLHTGLRKVYEQYIEFAREEYYDVLPLFIMGSYLYRLFKSTGYIHFNGTAASGKSQNLRILEALALNTVWASSMSAAALYRQIAGFPGVVLLDEAEGWEGERGEELRRILNAGYLDGSTVRRAEKGKNDTFQVVSFESYGPKAIASINPLDYVIGSRCLIVAMRPAIRTIPEFNKDDGRWQRLRDRLYLFAMTHAQHIDRLVDEWNDHIRAERAPLLLGRQWQITQMYVVLADYLDKQNGGDLCNRLIAFFNEYFVDLQKQQDATDRIRIVLKCLPRVLATKLPEDGGWYTIKAIHEEVIDKLEADAADYYKTRTLGKHLDVLGFKKKRSKKGGTQVWLDPDAVRTEFNQRRVEPYDEDMKWLAGEVDYEPGPPTAWDPDEE